MYEKNLTEDLRLRLSVLDMDFLRDLSDQRSCSISQVIRSIIGEYRRSFKTLSIISAALKNQESEDAVHGDTVTYLDDNV